MKWEAEKWRKLYRRVDASWLRLPVLARGLGSELLKYAEDDGRVAVMADEGTGEAVCRIMAAHKGERKSVHELVEKLIADRYIVREQEAILIRNFVPAQRRSSNAERQARYRERHSGDESDATPGAGDNVTPSVTSNGQRNGDVMPEVTAALPHEVTDRALPLSLFSGISGSLSADPQKTDPETAGARDSNGQATGATQTDLFGEPRPAAKRPRRGVETALPEDWKPEPRHFDLGRELGLSPEDVQREANKFRSDAMARDKRFVRWHQAFDTWLQRADGRGGGGTRVPFRGSPARPDPSRPAFAPPPDSTLAWCPEDDHGAR
jgi:hypothetical protein